MTESIIVALITGGLAFAGTLIACISSSSKTLYRIEQLEKKVDMHNNFAQRMPVIEQKIDDIERRVDTLEAKI